MTALAISAVKIAANTPARSSASSDTMRPRRRSVSIRRRNDRAGGRLRLMSTGASTSADAWGVSTGAGFVVVDVSGMGASLAHNAGAFHRFRHWLHSGVQAVSGRSAP